MIHRFVDAVGGNTSLPYVVLELAGEFNIWRVVAGVPTRLSLDTFDVRGGPELSPDESKIVYTRKPGGGFEVWVMDADGSNDVSLDGDGFGSEFAQYPSWSPDGTKIVYTWNAGGSSFGGEIRTINPDGTGKTTIWTPPTNAAARRPRYSADGSKIAFFVQDDGIGGSPFYPDDELWTMNADGSGDAAIQTLIASGFASPGFAWANLSNVIAYYSGNSGPTFGGIHRIAADGSADTLLSIVSDGVVTSALADLAWSPDDSAVFAGAIDSGGFGTGWVVKRLEADGSGETNLFTDELLENGSLFRQPWIYRDRLWIVPDGALLLASISLAGGDYTVEHTLTDDAVGDFFYEETGFENL